ncbi:MAG TPA: PAS domain S-box protein [Candidatus Thermoplasmatota archaeon]|nr:PAS domain S-box protein [Candidatus Thermoplasmatota archaeon]
MGDRRFEAHLSRVEAADDPAEALRDMSDGAVVEALAAASRSTDAYLANIIATEATNRMQRARTEVTHMGEGLCSLDVNGRILTANPAAESLLGWSQSELRGQDFDSLCRDGSVVGERSALGAYEGSIKAGLVVTCDTERFYRRDGSAFDVFYTAAPVIRDRAIEGIVISFHDISSSKLASVRLRESEARYRSLFENSPDFMFSIDMEGRVTAVSTSAAAVVGFDRAEISGRPFETFIAPGDEDAARRLVSRAREGTAERALVSLLRKDGRTVRTSLLAMPIILDGKIVGVYGLAESRGDLA